jgi:hypothetical protein
MPNPGAQQVLAAARQSLERPIDFEEFLARLPVKDRANAEKRVAALEAGSDPSHARLWRRLTCSLMTLAPLAPKLVGRQTVQFYVADGKYRMQVFALEDLQDGNMTIYCPDVLKEAGEAGLLANPAPGASDLYLIETDREPLRVEILNSGSLTSTSHVKDMTGWNRKALRITLAPSSSPAQIEAAEALCAIAAQRFVKAPSAAIDLTTKA